MLVCLRCFFPHAGIRVADDLFTYSDHICSGIPYYLRSRVSRLPTLDGHLDLAESPSSGYGYALQVLFNTCHLVPGRRLVCVYYFGQLAVACIRRGRRYSIQLVMKSIDIRVDCVESTRDLAFFRPCIL
jgi:hypothetical protein